MSCHRFTKMCCAFLCGVFLSGATLFSSLTWAQETSLSERPTSLDIVPENAAFYAASMNHAAIHQAIFESRAYQRLEDSPVGKKMRSAYRRGKRRGWDQFGDNPFRMFLEGYADSIGSDGGKIAMSMLKQIFGNEIFIYAHDDWNSAEHAVSQLYTELIPLISRLDLDEPDARQELERAIRDNLAGVNTPTLVMGTVMDHPEQIESLLSMADNFMELMLSRSDELGFVDDAYEVLKDEDRYLLSFRIAGDSIPWDSILDRAPEFDFLSDVFQDKSLAVAFGVQGSYLILTVGPSLDHLDTLGEGPLLIQSPKFKPLAEAAKTYPIQSVAYVSEKTVRSQQRSQIGMIDYLVSLAEVALRSEWDDHPFVDRLLEQLRPDAEQFKTDLAAILPTPGAFLSFAYLHPEGIEGYIYDWSENRTLDDSQPLDLLKHIGNQPTFVIAGREKADHGQFEFVKKWGAKLFGYVETIVPDLIEDEENVTLFNDAMTQVKPILKRALETTEQELIPATKNGQNAIVIDFASRRESWHSEMPATGHAVPIPAAAILIEVHDREKIERAGTQYLACARDFLDFLKGFPDLDIPDDFEIPDPVELPLPGAVRYAYELPEEFQLDESLAPHALLSDHWLALAYSIDQSDAFLYPHSATFWGPMQDLDQPRMLAMFYDHLALVDALEAWAQYGLQLARDQGESLDLVNHAESDLLDFEEAELLESLDRVFDFVKCFHGYSSSTTMQDGVQVTHFSNAFSRCCGTLDWFPSGLVAERLSTI